ncbi:MAG TPA: glutaredoxin domain-containing protein [Candidatus Saccharimonadales bacterium]|nr:glutaredoxin domain-containing protein [Candidatus Saccharimonadales bacterium]
MSNSNKASVTVYSATWCAFCHAAKDYLDRIGVKYTDKDVEADPAAGLEAFNKSGQRAIPVLDIGGDIVLGFDRPRIDAALKAHHLSS